MTAVSSDTGGLPLLVAVTGHRDLVNAEIPKIHRAITSCLKNLIDEYPEREIKLMSALATGADQVAADAALALGCELIAVLPMAADLYRPDFDTQESRDAFELRLASASRVIELSLAPDTDATSVGAHGAARDSQYARLGIYLAAHCHVLIAAWDGKPSTHVGGTGHVVEFHHDDVMPGHPGTVFATRQMLIDDESDLVFHVVCSRDRPNGEPANGLEPLQTCWFTKDVDAPRSMNLPQQHADIFACSAEFSRDVEKYKDTIRARARPLTGALESTKLPPGTSDIDHWYCAADVLAGLYQRKVLRTLRLTHVLAFLMGFCFILYADVKTEREFMLAFLGLFCTAAIVQFVAKRFDWSRKYFEYRALAEGLRVQFYWAAAGVRDENDARFTHDNFLRSHDSELGWIRNVMRVAGLEADSVKSTDESGLDFVIREWIGDNTSGQLGYFEHRAAARSKRDRLTERLGRLSLVTSVSMVVFFVIAGATLPPGWIGPLLAFMGALLLAYGIREGYAYAVAEKELIKQYLFMWRLFANARLRLESAKTTESKQQILRALGRAALDEHSEWVVMQRSRSIDSGEIWRMSS